MGDAASWQDDQTSRCAFDTGAELIEIILDRSARGATVRKDAIDTELGEDVDRLELFGGGKLIERHMERDAHAAAAHLTHALGNLDETRRGICVKLEALAF